MAAASALTHHHGPRQAGRAGDRALLLSALTYALAQTLVAPAIPALTREFGTESSTTSWVLTGFLLSASVCTPLAGKLGDLFGKARVLTGVLLIFSFGSIVSALAGSIEMVIAGRVIQGVAGGVFPLAFGIINDELPAERRSVAIGMISAMFGIGGGIGLPLSGAIVDNTDISWLFWIGLLALPAAFLVHRVVPPSPARERTRVDWAGAALLSLGLAALLLGISKANAWGWGSGKTMVALLGGRRRPGRLRRVRAAPQPAARRHAACSPSARCWRRTSRASSSAWRCSARSS